MGAELIRGCLACQQVQPLGQRRRRSVVARGRLGGRVGRRWSSAPVAVLGIACRWSRACRRLVRVHSANLVELWRSEVCLRARWVWAIGLHHQFLVFSSRPPMVGSYQPVIVGGTWCVVVDASSCLRARCVSLQRSQKARPVGRLWTLPTRYVVLPGTRCGSSRFDPVARALRRALRLILNSAAGAGSSPAPPPRSTRRAAGPSARRYFRHRRHHPAPLGDATTGNMASPA